MEQKILNPLFILHQEKFLCSNVAKENSAGILGKTTGWIHRSTLKKKNVQFIRRVSYTKIDDEGLHYIQNGEAKILEVDTIVICAGQIPFKELYQPLLDAGKQSSCHWRCRFSCSELDAKRAINQG